jgi:dephospho-CoA kinase
MEERLSMMVVGIVGLPASGKGEFSQIAREMNIPVVVMGDVIRRAVLSSGLDPTDENLGQMGNRLRAEQGMGAIAYLCIPVIEQNAAPLVVLDGIRGDAEVRVLRDHFKDFYLIGIQASFHLRLLRLQTRKRSDDSSLEEDLIQRDARECVWGLEKALSDVDCTLSNEGDLDSFQKRVRSLLLQLRKETS